MYTLLDIFDINEYRILIIMHILYQSYRLIFRTCTIYICISYHSFMKFAIREILLCLLSILTSLTLKRIFSNEERSYLGTGRIIVFLAGVVHVFIGQFLLPSWDHAVLFVDGSHRNYKVRRQNSNFNKSGSFIHKFQLSSVSFKFECIVAIVVCQFEHLNGLACTSVMRCSMLKLMKYHIYIHVFSFFSLFPHNMLPNYLVFSWVGNIFSGTVVWRS